MANDDALTLELETGDVGGQTHAEFGSHSRCQVPALRGSGKEGGTVAAGLELPDSVGGEHLGIVTRQTRVFDDGHAVRTVFAECLPSRADPGRTEEHRVHLAATDRVRRLPGCGHGLERYLAKFTITAFRQGEYRRHYNTFASV